jgi:predicted RNase H-like nuclease (RuvC/YqgF family)
VTKVEPDAVQAIIAALGGAAATATTAAGLWWKGRSDRQAKKVEAEASVQVAKIEADSSQELTVTERLFAQMEALRDHNADQDKAHVQLMAQIGDLKAELAKRDAVIDERDRQIASLMADLQRVKSERNESLEELVELRKMVGLAEGETEAWAGEDS